MDDDFEWRREQRRQKREELRLEAERYHRFSSISIFRKKVDQIVLFLTDMAASSSVPLVFIFFLGKCKCCTIN